MNRACGIVLTGFVICTTNLGCMGRAIREGAGAVRGASGKVVALKRAPSLSHFRGLTVEPIGVAAGLDVPSNVPELVRQAYLEAGAELGLTAGGAPSLTVRGEIIHYETGGTVDHAIGPLQEIIIRTRMSDSGSDDVLGEAHLVGRSKATTSSGRRNLTEGAGRALEKWLGKAGLSKDDD